jgi:hypothetical protein
VKYRFVSAALLLTLSGCGGGAIHYQGNNLDGLIQARYQCVQELSGDNATGSNNVTITVTSHSMTAGNFASCLASKGYILSKSGNIELPRDLKIRFSSEFRSL